MEHKKPFLWIEVNKFRHHCGARSCFDFVEKIFEELDGCSILNEPALNYVGLKIILDLTEEADKFGLPLFVKTNLNDDFKKTENTKLVEIRDWYKNIGETYKKTKLLPLTAATINGIAPPLALPSLAITAKGTGFDFVLVPGYSVFDLRGINIKKIATNVVPNWYFDEEKHTLGVTPNKAIQNGSDALVIGDWVTKNIDPARVLKNVLGDMFGKDFQE